MTSLRKKMIEDMTIRNLAERTIETYISLVARFALYFGRSPDRLGPEEIRAYQLHLTAKKVSWSAFNQTVCALRFLYRITLGSPFDVEMIPHAKSPKRLPLVLSPEEVLTFLSAVMHPLHRIALISAYATGLRVQELVELQACDINRKRMVVEVQRGKARS